MLTGQKQGVYSVSTVLTAQGVNRVLTEC